jgi:hypothetical protein
MSILQFPSVILIKKYRADKFSSSKPLFEGARQIVAFAHDKMLISAEKIEEKKNAERFGWRESANPHVSPVRGLRVNPRIVFIAVHCRNHEKLSLPCFCNFRQ